MAVKKRMARELPGWLQAVVALAVERHNFDYWTEAERKELTRKHISKDFALACLRRKPPFDDPFLRPRHNNWPYTRFCTRLVLAVDWKPDEVSMLLTVLKEEVKQEDSLVRPSWDIAASRAAGDKKRAVEILKEGMKRYRDKTDDYERWQLANEIWNVARLRELPYLTSRFFAEGDPWMSGGLQEALVKHVARAGPPAAARRFMRVILLDSRCKDIRWAPLEAVARSCNKLAGKEVIPEDELRNLMHPLGAYHFSRDHGFAEAKSKYPAETKKVLARLDDWRRRLQTYVKKQKW